ncbi:MAG: hypothetical protein HF976_11215 [ANME-2 cluster archaeon]|nr:hypothetical protein [ANME-2 cluster archaeon]MBC2701956.1 hypothetical protein [ANME-2 cluster archaeon]MBC2708981.1 hypothetical protein [ANME-2 cluster archaeon]MBC2745753.1 hypothetical protein [ANME-2 cluster archaeon]
MEEHICKIETKIPDISAESEVPLKNATFPAYIAFFDLKTPQKQAISTLKKIKNTCKLRGDPNTQGLTHRGHHPSDITFATTTLVVALRQYDSNGGQITLDKEVKTIHE